MQKIVRESARPLAAVIAILALMSGDAFAVTERADAQVPAESETAQEHSSRATAVSSPVWVEHSLAFRLRSELMLGGDLDNSSSAVPAALSEASADDDVASLLAWASMRMRYAVAIHVGEPWTIHLGLDALDNLVLGTTHVNAGGDFAQGLWRDAHASPSSGINSFGDALRVRHLYGTWRLMEFIDISAGRMPANKGLGIWRQAGLCPDCDYGTFVDGAQLGVDVFGFRAEVGWEASAVGATSEMPGMPGQALNLELADDVTTWTLSLGNSVDNAGLAPMMPASSEESDWDFDWSVYVTISGQSLDSTTQDLSLNEDTCAPVRQGLGAMVALDQSCWRLVPREASIVRPGGWVRALWRPSVTSSLRLELELSGVVGDIQHTQNSLEYLDSAKEILGFGGAFELEYEADRLRTGLDVGFATGDDGDYLGVSDGQNVNVPDAEYLDDTSATVRDNETLSSFWFHRDYHVDLLLFRQVIGTVTNAVYVRPWISYTLLDTESVSMGARFDALYAAAMNPEGTPGRGEHWGVELDASAWLDMPYGFGFSLHSGVLIPLDALNDRITGEAASVAFALRGLLSWRY